MILSVNTHPRIFLMLTLTLGIFEIRDILDLKGIRWLRLPLRLPHVKKFQTVVALSACNSIKKLVCVSYTECRLLRCGGTRL